MMIHSLLFNMINKRMSTINEHRYFYINNNKRVQARVHVRA